MTRYWMLVASKEHVMRGKAEGIAQVCHGKVGPLLRMSEGDKIIYYSPRHLFGGKDPYQAFTAIGTVTAEDPYQFAMSEDFIPWRRNIQFVTAAKDALIAPLLQKLSFTKGKKSWGLPFRRGCFEISQEDFQLIAGAMGINGL
ncbi:MAG: EVE domain-containing protein [Verrucomicrobia bacterium]|nr:EVE domain-containing protein [Verrucomicrobiota bacterium]